MLQFIEKLNIWVGKSVAWLTTALVGLVCFDVIRRYLLRDSSAWIMELEWHLFAIIFLLGAAYTLQEDKHVRVDLFYEKFTSRDKAKVNFWGSVVFLIPWCLVLSWVSLKYAMNSFAILEGSPDPGGLPARYIIKFCIPLGMTLLLLQAVVIAIRSWHQMKKSDDV